MPGSPASLPRRAPRLRVLVTAGPTHEPLDAVRFVGNRSSGRLGIEVARAAAGRGHRAVLLLGPTALAVDDSRVRVRRFQTARDLGRLLRVELPRCDLLIQAAAVADFRPRRPARGKVRRTAGGLVLRLEATPDLLAGCVRQRARAGGRQVIVGFALEPSRQLLASARRKLRRKGVDAIVANELSTMDAPTIRATVLFADGRRASTPGRMSKRAFAGWLLDRLGAPAGASPAVRPARSRAR